MADQFDSSTLPSGGPLVPNPNGDVLDLLSGRGNLPGWTSLPLATLLDRAKFAQALTKDPIELSRKIGDRIDVVHMVIDQRAKSDGTLLTHCVLITPEGVMYDGSGACLINSLRAMVLAMGRPPWSPPLTLMVDGISVPIPGGATMKAPAISLDYDAFVALLADLSLPKRAR